MPTTVQHRSTFGTASASVPLAFLSNNTAGNLLVCIIGGDATTTLTVTDNNGNTWTDPSLNALSAAYSQLKLWYVKSCNAGACTVTAHSAVAHDTHIHIYEISGCDTVAPFNASGVKTTGTGTAWSLSTSGAAAANDYVIAGFMHWVGACTWTAGGVYVDPEMANDATGGDSTFSEDTVASSAAIQTATATSSTSETTAQVALIATFLAAAGGSTAFAGAREGPTKQVAGGQQ